MLATVPRSAAFYLKVSAPVKKLRQRPVAKPKAGKLVVGAFECTALEGFGFGQLARVRENLAGNLAGLAVQDIHRRYPSRMDCQAKPSGQIVAAIHAPTTAIGVGSVHVVGNPARLRVTQTERQTASMCKWPRRIRSNV